MCLYAGLCITVCACSVGASDLVEFTDEEGYGKFLDLHECYVKFINLKGIEVQISVAVVTFC